MTTLTKEQQIEEKYMDGMITREEYIRQIEQVKETVLETMAEKAKPQKFTFTKLSYTKTGELKPGATKTYSVTTESGNELTFLQVNLTRSDMGQQLFLCPEDAPEGGNIAGSNDTNGHAIIRKDGKFYAVPLTEDMKARRQTSLPSKLEIAKYMAEHVTYSGGGKSGQPRVSTPAPIKMFNSAVLTYVMDLIKKCIKAKNPLTIDINDIPGFNQGHLDMLKYLVSAQQGEDIIKIKGDAQFLEDIQAQWQLLNLHRAKEIEEEKLRKQRWEEMLELEGNNMSEGEKIRRIYERLFGQKWV